MTLDFVPRSPRERENDVNSVTPSIYKTHTNFVQGIIKIKDKKITP